MKAALRIAALVLLQLTIFAAVAQDYPKRPVRILCPYPAGGTTDVYSRIVAAGLQQRLGQAFVVENKPGKATALAAEQVVKSPADGYTLMMVTVTTMAMNPLTMTNLYYRPEQLAPVALVLRQPYVLVASLQFKPNTVKELIAYAKANPGKINWATQGLGGSSHLVGELFKSLAHVDLFAVHYKGSAPANIDIMAGRADLHFDGTGTSLTNIQNKRVKAIAITSSKRMAAAPDIPTFVESGLPDMIAYTWYGIVTPVGTPQAVITKLNTEINAIVKTKEVVERMTADGSEPGDMTPAQFGKMIADEYALWKKILEPLHLQLD